MISVLIASYNRNVVNLIKELHLQLTNSKVDFEIICLDDASKSHKNIENLSLNNLSYCNFQELKDNIGRSAIRNLLASKAQYNWLLFLDADVLPTSSNFITNYIKELESKEFSVFLGGIKYRDIDNNNLLRWNFGKKSEEIPVSIRKENPNKYFFTANFLIEKEKFNSIKFNEELLDYGYEDLLFSKELEKKQISIKQLENEVFHLGIDENLDFINKTKKAIKNLNILIEKGLLKKEDTKLSVLYFKLKKYKIIGFISVFLKFFEKKAIQNSSVFFYNLFRISYLHLVVKNRK